jgi:hypothetical protein
MAGTTNLGIDEVSGSVRKALHPSDRRRAKHETKLFFKPRRHNASVGPNRKSNHGWWPGKN